MTAARRAPHVATASNGSGRNAETMITRMGNCVFSDRQQQDFPWVERRLKEMLRILQHRHGSTIPEIDDDSNPYFFAMCVTTYAWFRDAENCASWIAEWLEGFAPWLPNPIATADMLAGKMHPRCKHLTARSLGKLWRVTFEERQALGITTISAGDISPSEFKERLAEKKRNRDRERAAARRREAGSKARDHSAAREKPWHVEDISRATYYRRKLVEKGCVVNSSPPCEGSSEQAETISSPLCGERENDRETNSSLVCKGPETAGETNSSHLIIPCRERDEIVSRSSPDTSTLAPSSSNSQPASPAGRGKARPSRRRKATPSVVQLDLFPGNPS